MNVIASPALLWDQWCINSSNSIFDETGYAMDPTQDGGFILTGSHRIYTSNPYPNVWLVKTDAHGAQEWARTYGGNSTDFGTDVQQTADGGYICVGRTFSSGSGLGDILLIKTDQSGDSTWSHTFGGDSPDYGRSVQETTDGGFILIGETYSYGNGESDIWLLKTGTVGQRLGEDTDIFTNVPDKCFDSERCKFTLEWIEDRVKE